MAEVAYLRDNGMPLEKAAKKIVKGFLSGKFRVVVGRKMYWMDLSGKFFSRFVHKMIARNKNRFDFV